MKEMLKKSLDALKDFQFPVLAQTRQLFAETEQFSQQQLAELVGRDPGLAINIMRRVNTVARSHLNHRLTTIDYTVMMLGMGPIQQIVNDAATVEESVAEPFRAPLLAAYLRSPQMAMYAEHLALQRKDLVPDEIYLAGLLHNLAEISLWLVAPEKMRYLHGRLAEQPENLDEIEYLVFGFGLNALSLELAKLWNMPALVYEAMQPGNASKMRVKGIMLAARISFLYRHGSTTQLQRLLSQTASYLSLSVDELTQQLDLLTTTWGHLMKGYVPLLALAEFRQRLTRHDDDEAESEPAKVGFCLVSRPRLILQFENELKCAPATPEPDLEDVAAEVGNQAPVEAAQQLACLRLTLDETFEEVTRLMHDGAGLNRVTFVAFNREKGALQAKFSVGADSDLRFCGLTIDASNPNLFSQLLRRPDALWVKSGDWERYGSMIPEVLSGLNASHSFFGYSIVVRGKPIGVFYADRRSELCQLDKLSFARFKRLGMLAQREAQQMLGRMAL